MALEKDDSASKETPGPPFSISESNEVEDDSCRTSDTIQPDARVSESIKG